MSEPSLTKASAYRAVELLPGYSWQVRGSNEYRFTLEYLAAVREPFTEADLEAQHQAQGFPPGRVRRESAQPGDCIEQPDGSFRVTYRFLLLPEPDVDAPQVVEVQP